MRSLAGHTHTHIETEEGNSGVTLLLLRVSRLGWVDKSTCSSFVFFCEPEKFDWKTMRFLLAPLVSHVRITSQTSPLGVLQLKPTSTWPTGFSHVHPRVRTPTAQSSQVVVGDWPKTVLGL